MGEILDFKGPKTTVAFPEFSNPAADNECELEYDPKPGSVGVLVTTDAQGVAHFTVTAPAAVRRAAAMIFIGQNPCKRPVKWKHGESFVKSSRKQSPRHCGKRMEKAEHNGGITQKNRPFFVSGILYFSWTMTN